MSSQIFKNCIFESILAHKQNSEGRYEFLIKWKKSSPSWQPFQNLTTITAQIRKYLNDKQIINYETWGRSFTNCEKEEKFNAQLEDQNTCSSLKSLCMNQGKINQKSKSDYILKFNEQFHLLSQNPKTRYKSKQSGVTSESSNINIIILNQSYKIQWKSIKKAIKIEFDEQKNKWMVLVQLFDSHKQNIWIQRDILRLVNPYMLLDFYIKLQHIKIQNKNSCINKEIENQDNEQNSIEIIELNQSLESQKSKLPNINEIHQNFKGYSLKMENTDKMNAIELD